MTIQIDSWLKNYLDGVWQRRGQAVDPTRLSVTFADDSTPEVACCHTNVDRYVSDHSECQALRGWAIIAISGDRLYLAAHSVVRTKDGSLLEITPLPAQRVAFIAHAGGEEDFTRARSVFTNVWWPQ